jgi:glycosyltransferase involved in cell wall biosynthesis
MPAETISVIIPIKGDGPYLAPALDSIARQRVPVLEVLVIDDGMDAAAHATLAAAAPAEAKLTVIEGPRAGPAAARNSALRRAQGSLIAFLDDDDLWPDDKLARQCRYLADRADALAVGGRIFWFYDWDEAGLPRAHAQDQSVVHVNLGALLVRRNAFDRLGLLDEALLYSEDVDFVLRLVDSGSPFSILDEDTLHYRRHHLSMTGLGSEREMIDFRRALFASLRRRRGGPGRKLEEFLVAGPRG